MDPLAAAVGLNQHHDAVSGTEMQHVAYDYAARLAAGAEIADQVSCGPRTQRPQTPVFLARTHARTHAFTHSHMRVCVCARV